VGTLLAIRRRALPSALTSPMHERDSNFDLCSEFSVKDLHGPQHTFTRFGVFAPGEKTRLPIRTLRRGRLLSPSSSASSSACLK